MDIIAVNEICQIEENYKNMSRVSLSSVCIAYNVCIRLDLEFQYEIILINGTNLSE